MAVFSRTIGWLLSAKIWKTSTGPSLSFCLSLSPSLFLSNALSFPLHPPLFTFTQCLYLLLLYKNCERTLLQKTLDAKFGLDFFKNPFAHMLVFSSSGFGFIIILPSLNILITTERIPFLYYLFMCLCLCMRTLSVSKVCLSGGHSHINRCLFPTEIFERWIQTDTDSSEPIMPELKSVRVFEVCVLKGPPAYQDVWVHSHF